MLWNSTSSHDAKNVLPKQITLLQPPGVQQDLEKSDDDHSGF